MNVLAALVVLVVVSAAPGMVVSDPDTALISQDPGQRVIDALAAHAGRIDVCLIGYEELIEQGAPVNFSFVYSPEGRLVSLGGSDQAEHQPSGMAKTARCLRKVLSTLRVGASSEPRRGTLFFKLGPTVTVDGAVDQDELRLEKEGQGVKAVLVGRRTRVAETNGYGISYQATITNTGTKPRGVRRSFLYASIENTTEDRMTRHSGVLQTDRRLPVVCLQPGETLEGHMTPAADDTIVAGGWLHSAPFVQVGDCGDPDGKLWVGGFRLDWTARGAAPRLRATAHWIDALDPVAPRQRWR